MLERVPSSYTVAELDDPEIRPMMLEQIARARPDLWEAILKHPNCPAELTFWIRRQFTAPSSEETLAADAAERVRQVSSAAQWRKRAGLTLIGSAVLGIISLFLPLGTISLYGESTSLNYFSPLSLGFSIENLFAAVEGIMLLTAMGLVLLFAIAMLLREEWARITVGILGITAGTLGMYDGFVTMHNFNEVSFLTLGAGAILLSITSIVLFLGGIVALLPISKTR